MHEFVQARLLLELARSAHRQWSGGADDTLESEVDRQSTLLWELQLLDRELAMFVARRLGMLSRWQERDAPVLARPIVPAHAC